MDVQFYVTKRKEEILVHSIRKTNQNWYLFDKNDKDINKHPGFLKYKLASQLRLMKNYSKLRTRLNEEQIIHYYDAKNNIFVFKNKPLIEDNKQDSGTSGNEGNDNLKKPPSNSQKKKFVNDLIFDKEKMNPLDFISELEECHNNDKEEDKKFNLLKFVDDDHKDEFNSIYISNNYEFMKDVFVKKYSIFYCKNVEKKLKAKLTDFGSLYEYFIFKYDQFKKLTSYNHEQIVDQIVRDLGSKIHELFLLKNKLKSSYDDILKFCLTLDEVIENLNGSDDTFEREGQSFSETSDTLTRNDSDNNREETGSPLFMVADDLASQNTQTSNNTEVSNTSSKKSRGRPKGSTKKTKIFKQMKDLIDDSEEEE